MPDSTPRKFHHLVVLATFAIFVATNAVAQNDSWVAPQKAVQLINPVKPEKASIDRGRERYLELCSPCHGNKAMGDGPVAKHLITESTDLTALKKEQTDGELAWKIATGRNPMPKWEDELNREDIWDIVNFIRRIQKDSE